MSLFAQENSSKEDDTFFLYSVSVLEEILQMETDFSTVHGR